MAASKSRSAKTARLASSSVRISAAIATSSVPTASRSPRSSTRWSPVSTGPRSRTSRSRRVSSTRKRKPSSSTVRRMPAPRWATFSARPSRPSSKPQRRPGAMPRDAQAARLDLTARDDPQTRARPAPSRDRPGGLFLWRPCPYMRRQGARPMPLEVHQFPCLDDNYGFLLHDPDSLETTCIDTPDADAYLREAAAKGWQITHIRNTHWHPDHAGGNEAIKAVTGCKVIAPAGEADKIPAVDTTVKHGDFVCLGEWEAEVIDVGGHTMGHNANYLPPATIPFAGDSLFALGCGRMFEGTAPQFWNSLKRVKALP